MTQMLEFVNVQVQKYIYVNEPKTIDILGKGMKEFQQKYENCIKSQNINPKAERIQYLKSKIQ